MMRKASDKPRGDTLQDTWPLFPKTVHVTRNKERQSVSRGHGGDVATKCNVVPGTGSWEKKKTIQGKLVKSTSKLEFT